MGDGALHVIAGQPPVRADAAQRDSMRREIMSETLEAFDFALASPNPTESDLYKHVYAE